MPPSVEPDHSYHIDDIFLQPVLQFALETLEISKDDMPDKLREVLDRAEAARLERDEVRGKKAAKLKADMDGIEVLDHHVAKDEVKALVFKQEQEIRIGMPVTLSRKSGKFVFEEDAGYNQGPLMVKALTAMVQGSVGDNEKLYLKQSFCLKRQSDLTGQNVNGKSVVLDDEFQDTPLFGYRPKRYTEIERRTMAYASCLGTTEDASSPRHWVDSLDALLSARNQHDQPFSTRVKVYLVNRPETVEYGPRKSVKGFWDQCPARTSLHSYCDLNRGVWKSLRIGLTFEMYVNPAKMDIRPSTVLALNNRRIIMQAVCPGSITVRALAAEGNSIVVKLEDFYANLLPAPVLSTTLDEYQPEGMLATLLPFQRRTVAWLVDRERDADSHYQSIGMWEKLPLGLGADAVEIAYNRITGEALPLSSFDAWNKGKGRSDDSTLQDGGFDDTVLQEDRDDYGLRVIRGGMLCEEMG